MYIDKNYSIINKPIAITGDAYLYNNKNYY